MWVIRSNTSVTTDTQRAISACLHNNILFRRLCAFYVQSLFYVLDSLGIGAMPDAEAFGDVGVDTFGHIADTVKAMETPNLKKLGMLNLHPTKEMLLAAFGAAIKDVFFVVSVKQKREFCWRFFTFSSTREEKGEMLLERPVFSFFSKLIMPLFYDKKFLRGRWFEESSLGWTWCWRNLWMQKVKGINRDIPFPVFFRNEVSSAENLVFDPDDMNDFNAFGCYFQNFAAKIVIGKGSYIAPNVGLVTANHVLTDLEQHQPGKDIVLGKNCWIGMNSTVLPGVVLGDHTVVGAGSVVTKSVSVRPWKCSRRQTTVC